MDDLLNRLEKSAGLGGGLFKGFGNYLKNVSNHNVRKLEKANALPKEINNAKVDRNIARAGTAAVGMLGGAGYGGYKAYEGTQQQPLDTTLYEQNQFTQDNLQPKIAFELMERLEKTAKQVQGDDNVKEANELLERLEKTASQKEVQAIDEDLFARLEKTANPFEEKEKEDEDEKEQKAPQQSNESSEPKQPQSQNQEQPTQQEQQAQPEQQAQLAQLAQQAQPEPAPQQQQVPLAAQQPLPEQAEDPRLLILQQILAEQQQSASTPVQPPVQEVPQEVGSPVPQDPHLELQQLLAEQQSAAPVTAPSMEGYGALENGDVTQEDPRQGAGSVSNAPAGVDKTASLIESLEKTAAGIPGLGSVVNAVAPKAQNLALKGAQKAGDFSKNIGGGDAKAGLKKIVGGTALVGGGMAAGAGIQAANDNNNMSKAAAEETPAEQKSIADKSEKEWIDFMHKVEKEDGVKAEEKPENQSKTASEDDDMLNGLFKEAASAIMDMHFPEIRQHVDPMQRITFSK